MKRLIFTAFACSLLLLGCKTTEANYRAAYEVAKASQQKDSVDADDGLNENTRRLLAQNKRTAMATHIIGNDTIKITTLFVTMLDDQPMDRVPQFSVVLNAFSQKFNAKAMCRRLIEAGFKGAYVFQTATPDYYVAAAGTNSLDSVPLLIHSIPDPVALGSRAGFPQVIRSGGYRSSKPITPKP